MMFCVAFLHWRRFNVVWIQAVRKWRTHIREENAIVACSGEEQPLLSTAGVASLLFKLQNSMFSCSWSHSEILKRIGIAEYALHCHWRTRLDFGVPLNLWYWCSNRKGYTGTDTGRLLLQLWHLVLIACEAWVVCTLVAMSWAKAYFLWLWSLVDTWDLWGNFREGIQLL